MFIAKIFIIFTWRKTSPLQSKSGSIYEYLCVTQPIVLQIISCLLRTHCYKNHFHRNIFLKILKIIRTIDKYTIRFFMFVCVNVLHSRMNFKWKGKRCTEFEMTPFSKWYRWKRSKCLIQIHLNHFLFGISSSLCSRD